MADLSKIKLNGTTYNFKDAEVRNTLLTIQNTLENKADKEKFFTITYNIGTWNNEQHIPSQYLSEMTVSESQEEIDEAYSFLSGVRDKTTEQILAALQDGYTVVATFNSEFLHPDPENPTYDISKDLGLPAKVQFESTEVINPDYPIRIETNSFKILDTNNFSGTGRGQACIYLGQFPDPIYVTEDEFYNTVDNKINYDMISRWPYPIAFLSTSQNGSYQIYLPSDVHLLGTSNILLYVHGGQATRNIAINNGGDKYIYQYDWSYKTTQSYKIQDVQVTDKDNNISTTIKVATFYILDFNTNNKILKLKELNFNTEMTETDPTVPAWAKAANKPTYTASEVGALPDTYTAPVTSVNGNTGAVTTTDEKVKYTPLTGSDTNSYGVLFAQNNGGTEATTTAYSGRLRFQPSTGKIYYYNSTGSRVGTLSYKNLILANDVSGYNGTLQTSNLAESRTYTLPDASGTVALTSDIPSVPSWALTTNKPNYTFSELTSHPTSLSEYGITDAYTKTEIDGLVSGVLHYKGTKATTSALPSSGNITGDVWHITADGSEWAWDGSAWQELGTAVDLTGYLQSSDIAAWAKAATKPTYTASEVGAITQNDLDNFSDELNETLSDVAFSGRFEDLYEAPDMADYLQTTDIADWAKAGHKPTYTATEVGALPSNTTYVSSVNGNSGAVTLIIPTDTNDLTNGAGFITSYTETDPTVPAWAKAASKPTYTATEVGALPSNTTYVSSVNGSSGVVTVDKIKTTASSNNTEYNLLGTATTNNNTAAVSTYKQDLLSFAKTTTLSRLTIGSTSLPGVVRIYTSTNGASGYADLKVNVSGTNAREITFPDKNGTVAMIDDIPNVPSWALNTTKPSYTFSELTSHPTTLNDYGITDAYTKTEVDGLVSGVLHYKGTKATTSTLPASGNITGDVWHITADGSEWAWDGSTWQELGTTIDLSGYLQSSDIAAWAKAANKPTYTASEVDALPSSTTYVSSFNGESGAITYVPPVTSVNEQTGAVVLSASDIGAATPYQITSGVGYSGNSSAFYIYLSNYYGNNSYSNFMIFVNRSHTINSTFQVYTLLNNANNKLEISKSNLTINGVKSPSTINSGLYYGTMSAWSSNATVTLVSAPKMTDIQTATTVSNTLSSGTLIATINGTNIYAPAYTDADGVSY